eukprot:TRINITY_DN18583_c0_g1_i9.p1 TRINITY_DN18583_c0_g1~~TRINITY_DN18583_c0_g1_i9.p1  ORF type:complete len:345 (+),score=110.93 TRINITY_DN18583_c0_g1_i9:85-1035(+)
MSFGGGGWSDDEAPAAAAPRRAARRPVPLQRRAGVRRKREEDDAMDEDGPPAAAAAAAPAPSGGAKRQRLANAAGGQQRALRRGDAAKVPSDAPPPPGLGRFHSVADPNFSTQAMRPPGEDEAERFAQKAGGWLSGDCRCLQCELTRTAQLLSKKQEPRVCVLWDLDNYGFPEAVKRDAPAAAEQLPPQLVVWAFYGLGWTELRKTEPEKQITGRSLFGVLRRGKSLHITPCGNFPQAADEAMQRVVRIMRNVHIVVVSGDKPHLLRCRKAHAQQRRIPGQPRTEFGRINPAESGRDVDKVWQQIRAFCQAAQGGD